MRTLVVLFLVGLFMCTQLQAQVKIGDNPQNIDPAAVLELESSTMALIITRVTTEQMNAITPGQGALVYNTDTACVHCYNGTEWVNLCAGATGSITGEQIEDGSIFGVDFNDNSITGPKLANNAVTKIKISENAVGPFAIDRDSLPLSYFINDVPFLTAGDITIVSGDADNSITQGGDGGAFFNAAPLFDAVANDLDDDPENEVQALSRSGTDLILTRPNGVNFSIPLDDLAGTGTDNQNLGPATLDATNMLTIGIEDGMETTVDLSSLAAVAGSDNQNLGPATLSPTNVLTIEIEDGMETTVDLGSLAGSAGGNQNLAQVLSQANDANMLGITNLTTDPADNTAAATVGYVNNAIGSVGTPLVFDEDVFDGDGSTTTPYTIQPGEGGQFLTTDDMDNVVWTSVTPGDDDQTAAEVAYDPATGDLPATITNTQAAIDALAAEDSDNQLLTLATGNVLTLEDGGTVNLTPFLDDQTAAQVTVAATTGLNYTPSAANVEGHLAGINTALAGGVGHLNSTNLTQTLGVDRTYDINNGNLIFTGTGSVGIGDNANPPQNKLDVDGQIRARSGFAATEGSAGNPGYGFYTNGDTNVGMYRPGTDRLAFTTNGTEALRIGDNQNVGIGSYTPVTTANPTSKLQVQGSFATAARADSGAITLDENDHTILLNGASVLTFPAANTCPGRIYILKNQTSVVTISAPVVYFEPDGTIQNAIPTGTVVQLQSIGNEWHQIN